VSDWCTDFVNQSASSHFPPCVCTRPPREGLVCLSTAPLLCAPRVSAPFWCLLALLLLRLFLVAFLCNTTHRYVHSTYNHYLEPYMGGVNHCSLHCCLAKFCGLMIRGKYGAVIGLKEPITWKLILSTFKKTRCSTNHRAVFPPYHQTTEFR